MSSVRVYGALLLAALACGDDHLPPPPIGGANSASVVAIPSAPSRPEDGGETTSSQGPSTGSTSATAADCRTCWNAACSAPLAACFADTICGCNFGCEGDLACESSCGGSVLFGELRTCIADATIDECEIPCNERCRSCAADACSIERELCLVDFECECKLSCGGDVLCELECGADNVAFEELELCLSQSASACDGCPIP